MKDFDDRIDRLLEGLRQGEMNADEVRELERLLQSDAALRQRYLDRIWMEEELKDTFGQASDMILPFELERGSKRSPRAMAWLGGIAAAIAALLAVVWMAKPAPPPTVATLESRSADTWDGPLVLGGWLQGGTGRGPPGIGDRTVPFRFGRACDLGGAGRAGDRDPDEGPPDSWRGLGRGSGVGPRIRHCASPWRDRRSRHEVWRVGGSGKRRPARCSMAAS